MNCVQCGQPFELSSTLTFEAICQACKNANAVMTMGHRTQSVEDSQTLFVNDVVEKVGGDYVFKGVVVAAFPKMSGKWRYVVENNEKLLHIFSGKQLKKTGVRTYVGDNDHDPDCAGWVITPCP